MMMFLLTKPFESKVVELMLVLSDEFYLLRRHLFLCILLHDAVTNACILASCSISIFLCHSRLA